MKVIAKLLPPEEYQRHVLEATITEEQSRIGKSYGETIRERVLTLLPEK